MSDSIVSIDQPQTPFDCIRRYHADGTEFWTARDLMPVLGYKTWQKFTDALDRAMTACANASNQVTEHFLPMSVNTKQAGRPQENFELSRFGCYLIAMNGDPRKPEIAAAQSYFAIKTREAEVIIPAQNDRIRELELANENMKLMLQWATKQDNRIALHGLPIALMLEGKTDAVVEVEKPTIEVFDDRDGQQVRYVGQTCAQLKDYMKSRYGIAFKSGTDVKRVLEKIEAQTGESLLGSAPRKVITDYVPSECSDKAISYLRDVKNWQMLLGQ